MPRIYERRPLAERLWEKVRKADGCWLWTGWRNHKGYGGILTGSKKSGDKRCSLAHRVAWEVTHGPIPSGMCVLHRCDVPACVRPDHLFLGTLAENNQDCSEKERWSRVPRSYGVANNRAKITDADVVAIRAAYTGERGQLAQLGRRFGIAQGQIKEIVQRRAWKHVA